MLEWNTAAKCWGHFTDHYHGQHYDISIDILMKSPSWPRRPLTRNHDRSNISMELNRLLGPASC